VCVKFCIQVGVGLVLLVVAASASAQTLASGANHTIILKSDGTVWTIGLNSSGQLGDNTTTTRKTPIQVAGLSDIVAVAAGGNHSMALTSDGVLYVWGSNTYGQVGDASTTVRKTPVQSNLTGIVAIAAGEFHSVALKSNGDVYTWGRNNVGQLGDGSTTQSTSPISVVTSAAAIGAGFDHTLFVKTDGTVYAAGENGNGQLGDGTTTDRSTPVQMSGVSGASKAAGGERHSVILLSDGTLKASGYNASGQLGDTTTTQRTTAVTVSTVSNITAIASGADHVLARESDSTVWAWGANSSGQLGDASTTPRSTPAEVTLISSITKIGAGWDNSLAVTSTGVVYVWGDNDNYQVGDGTNILRWRPTALSSAGYDWMVATPTISLASGTYTTNKTATIAVVTSGATIRYTQNGVEPTESDASITSGSSLSITESQTLYVKAFKSGMPASNTGGAVYTMEVAAVTVSPSTATYTSAQSVTMSTATSGAAIRYTTDGTTPTEASTLYASAISVGTSTVVKAAGFKTNWTASGVTTRTYTMNFGTLSAPTSDQATGSYVDSVTVTLTAMAGAQIRYTTNNTAPLSSSTLYTGPLAIDTTTTLRAKAFHPDYATSAETSRTFTLAAAAPTFNPTAGTYVAGQAVTVTSPSIGSTVHYTINGAEPTTGDPTIASGGTLVVGNYTLKAKAWKTGADASATATAAYTVTGEVTPPALSAGADHSLAIRNDGVAWGWGRNANAQLGDGTQTSPRLLPQTIPGVTGAAAITGGSSHSHLLKIDGTVMAFGPGTSGRLGDGTDDAHLMPFALPGLTGVVALDGGDANTVALKGDGTVVAWGANSQGQVGDGTTTTRLSPTAVSSLTTVTAISAGEDFALAVKQDGTVWAWGDNQYGQLGDNSTNDRLAPVEVSTLATVTAVAAGRDHGLAVLSDGTAWAWGHNGDGALGDGTATNRLEPVQVAGLSGVTKVAAGTWFSMALDGDGHVWTWGTNSSGQLGDGTTTERLSAAQVAGLTDIVQIAAGDAHALALASDGTVYAWGENGDGQLGDGTTIDRWVPVAISGTGMAWRVATPVVSLASGLFYTNQSVTISVADPGATLRYTTTGVDPTASDATVTSGGSIAVEQIQTLKVSGWKSGSPTSVVVARAYELKVVTPSMTPGAGAYGSAQSVAMASTTSGATLRYTTDGTEPTASSAAYTTALTVSDTQTVKARAYKTGWTASDSGHASYWISGGTVATPTITPAGGAHASAPLVAITTTTSGATVRYTLDGTTPTGASPVYAYPFLVPATTTVKAKAFKAGYTASATASTTYDVDAAGATATPAIVPAGGWYAVAQTVTITGPSGATLRYTTDGSDPTTSSSSITSGNTLAVAKSQVLKVRAWATGLNASAVRRADFVITGAVTAGSDHSLALAADGTAWAFGSDVFGQLGNGAGAVGSTTPIQVLTGVAAVSAGDRHSLAVKGDGTLWSWGDSSSGKLGNGGTSGTTNSPLQISGFTGATAVAAGRDHSLVLKSDGTVWAFGGNSSGQLGDGTTTQRTTAVQVQGISNIVAIAIGREASYALQLDGAAGGIVWAWGDNTYGQLGDGSTLSRSTPTRVTALPAISALATGMLSHFGTAVGTDGRVYAWGQNANAQLGIGVTADQVTPVQVPTVASARLLAAGSDYAVAVDRSGRGWAWGDTTTSALGVGPVASQYDRTLTPEQSDIGNVLSIVGGDEHTLAIRPDGAVLGFGLNNGKLGNGSTDTAITGVIASGLVLADNTWLAGDADQDGLPTWREYLLGTDPLNPDSNGNGVLDGHDDPTGASPADPDVDGDGVPNWIEGLNGTDPFRADTDGDSVSDLNDAFPLDPTRSMAPSSNPSDTTPPIVTLKAPVSARPVL